MFLAVVDEGGDASDVDFVRGDGLYFGEDGVNLGGVGEGFDLGALAGMEAEFGLEPGNEELFGVGEVFSSIKDGLVEDAVGGFFGENLFDEAVGVVFVGVGEGEEVAHGC